MIIWTNMIHQQKEAELKTIDLIKQELHLHEVTQQSTPGLIGQLQDFLYGTMSIEAKPSQVVIDATIQQNETAASKPLGKAS